jgi:hypothetical protein
MIRVLPLAGILFAPLAVAISAATAQQNWIEITPTSGPEPGVVQVLETSAAEPLRWQGPEDRYIVCTGGPDRAVQCDPLFLQPGDPLPTPIDDGLPVVGRILVGKEPAPAATVTVFPEALAARRPFVLPLFLQRNEGLQREVRSDAEGRFRTPILAPGRYALEFTTAGGRRQFSAPFLIRSRRELDEEKGAREATLLDLGDLRLPAGLAVQVSVLTPDGLPIEKAKLIASQGTGLRDRVAFFGSTDTEGLGILREIQANAPVQVRCEAEGFSPLEKRFSVPPDAMLCVLQPLAKIRGTVLAEGEPVPQATLATLLPPAFPGAARQRRTVATDEEGHFEIANLTPRTYELSVAAPGFRAETLPVELNPGDDRLLDPIELIPAAERFLRVTDATNQEPIPGALILPVEPPGLAQGVTDENGETVLALGAGGTVTLRITAAGFPPAVFALPPEPPADGEADAFALDRGGSILIEVWSETGDPCTGCDVAFYRPGGEPLALPTTGLRTDGAGQAKTPLLPAGSYHVTLEEARSVGGAVEVSSGRFHKVADVRPGEVTPVRLGQPAQTVAVEFWPTPPPDWRLQGSTARDIQTYAPDTDGTFTIRQHPGESLTLRLIHEGISVSQTILSATFDEPRLRLDLPETRVRGQVESDGNPLDVRLQSITNPALGAWTVAGPTGHFQIPFVPPGGYVLVIQGTPVSAVTVAAGTDQDLGVVSLP